MFVYPYTSPIILTDAIYQEYGGYLDTCTPQQRQAAYLLAEIQMTDALSTFLLPTVVTGSYSIVRISPYLLLDHTYVSLINSVSFLDSDGDSYISTSTNVTDYSVLRNGLYGQVDILGLFGMCKVCSNSTIPYRIDLVYTAGLPTGTANNPDILLALTEYAKIIVNEIIGYGNESTGDIGVQEFKNQQYSEIRVKLLRTTFGNSAMAQFINRLIDKYKVRRWVSL